MDKGKSKEQKKRNAILRVWGRVALLLTANQGPHVVTATGGVHPAQTCLVESEAPKQLVITFSRLTFLVKYRNKNYFIEYAWKPFSPNTPTAVKPQHSTLWHARPSGTGSGGPCPSRVDIFLTQISIIK